MKIGPQSVLDNDLYKFTMQQAVLDLYPHTQVEYRFTNRRPDGTFNEAFYDALRNCVQDMKHLSAATEAFSSNSYLTTLACMCPFLKPHYLHYLKNYRFNPDEVGINVVDGELEIKITGLWHKTILWEVPLMSLISELYFRHCDLDWTYDGQRELAKEKGRRLIEGGCYFADFGTRRRRSWTTQKDFVTRMTSLSATPRGAFTGTSNVQLAIENDIMPIGTMAHEWIMASSALEGMRHANRHALLAWQKVYNGNLGIALTDTYGSNAFFNDFDLSLAQQFNGVRHDSGDPFEFIDKVCDRYRELKISPESKGIVFSDGLDVDKAIELRSCCYYANAERGTERVVPKIKPSFGIGTHFTNDFENSPALNMVIKLWSVDGIPVVKLGDDPGKSQGREDAVRVAKWTFNGADLDE